MDEKRFHQIVRGDYSNLPKDKSKVVRIFLSSTFSGKLEFSSQKYFNLDKNYFFFVSDTHTERDYLIANVYPKLKTFCNTEYNIDFQVNYLITNDII